MPRCCGRLSKSMLRRAKGGRDVDEGSARRAREADEDVEGQERSAGEVVVVDKAGDGEEGVAVGVAGGGGKCIFRVVPII